MFKYTLIIRHHVVHLIPRAIYLIESIYIWPISPLSSTLNALLLNITNVISEFFSYNLNTHISDVIC